MAYFYDFLGDKRGLHGWSMKNLNYFHFSLLSALVKKQTTFLEQPEERFKYDGRNMLWRRFNWVRFGLKRWKYIDMFSIVTKIMVIDFIFSNPGAIVLEIFGIIVFFSGHVVALPPSSVNVWKYLLKIFFQPWLKKCFEIVHQTSQKATCRPFLQ